MVNQFLMLLLFMLINVCWLCRVWFYPTHSRDSGLVQTCKGMRPSSVTAFAFAPYISSNLVHSGWQFSQDSCRAVVPPGARSTFAPRWSKRCRQSANPRPAVMWSGVVSSCSYVSDQSPAGRSKENADFRVESSVMKQRWHRNVFPMTCSL